MAVRWMTLPMVMGTRGRTTKYFASLNNSPGAPELAGAQISAIAYGDADLALGWSDLTGPQVTFLQAQADVRLAPVNIDNQIGAGNLATVTTYLEAAGRDIPAHWITASMTWRVMLRGLAGLFQFASKYSRVASEMGAGRTLLPAGFDKDLAWSDVPQIRQDAVTTTAVEFGYSMTGITGSTTVREVLRILGAQWASQPIHFGAIVL